MEIPTRSESFAHRAVLIAALAAASSFSAGCASSKPNIHVVWPPPPEKARIEYIQLLRSQEDLGQGAGRRLASALLPHGEAVVVSPSGLALSPDEKRLYVALGGRGRILVIDREARTMSLLSSAVLTHSVGVALDADENVYVTDRIGNAVSVFDRKGALLRKIGGDVLQGPTAIAIDRPAQQLYVLNGAKSKLTDHRIEVFSLAGKHIRTMGSRGAGPGEFNYPSFLFAAPDGSLFVSDTLNFRVQQFDRTGQVVGSFGQLGTGGPGAFDKIKGIAVDAFGNIYVVDSMQGVHILNPAHRPLLLFGGPPVMATPGPIVIDSKNRIFVADFGLNAIHEFQLVNTTAEDSYDSSQPPPAAPAPAPQVQPAADTVVEPAKPAGSP